MFSVLREIRAGKCLRDRHKQMFFLSISTNLMECKQVRFSKKQFSVIMITIMVMMMMMMRKGVRGKPGDSKVVSSRKEIVTSELKSKRFSLCGVSML